MSKKQLMRYNPQPAQFPIGKHKVSKRCEACDIVIVRPRNFDTCPYCGGHVQ